VGRLISSTSHFTSSDYNLLAPLQPGCFRQRVILSHFLLATVLAASSSSGGETIKSEQPQKASDQNCIVSNGTRFEEVSVLTSPFL
jgi:hypothetical protein